MGEPVGAVRFEAGMPRLGFGCGSVMGRVGRRESLAAMHAAWDAGVTLFDTARSYGYGEAEALLGEFLAGRRAQATVVTKFGILPSRASAWKTLAKPLVRRVLAALPELRDLVRQGIVGQSSPGHFDVATLRSSLEESLRQLRTDHIDILLAHEAPASIMAQEDLMAELESIVREGKARSAGVSSNGLDAAFLSAQGPKILSVVQYPAWGISDWPVGRWDDRVRMANHVFGGATRAAKIGACLQKLAANPQVAAELRAKLGGDARELAAIYCFTRARLGSRPHALITSMIQPGHLRANLAAMHDERFSAGDVHELGHWLSAAGTFS